MNRLVARVRIGKRKRVALVRVDRQDLVKGRAVVIRSEHGTELATLLETPRDPDAVAVSQAVDPMRLDPRAFWEWVQGERVAATAAPVARDADDAKDVERVEFLRAASTDDVDRANLLLEHDEGGEFEAFRSLVERLNVPLKPVQVEHVLGGESILFFFASEDRVDLRELTRQLQARFRTRVELRRINPRQAAAMSCGVGVCGQELCCSTWLKVLKPVTAQMAKDQARPSSGDGNLGVCGRLKCCLRYELQDDGQGGCGKNGSCGSH
ncbi:MAG: hypothetical protein JNL94_18885 [Planctomycetes bacterium]|nr:hypothetical protein [Planctomycetota bacterium]